MTVALPVAPDTWPPATLSPEAPVADWETDPVFVPDCCADEPTALAAVGPWANAERLVPFDVPEAAPAFVALF